MTRTARRGVLAVWYLRVACSGVHAHAFAHDACACPCAAAASASLAPIPVCCLCDWQGAAGQSPGSASSSAAPLDSLDGRSGEGVGQMEQAGSPRSGQDRSETTPRSQQDLAESQRDLAEIVRSRREIVPRSCRDRAGLPRRLCHACRPAFPQAQKYEDDAKPGKTVDQARPRCRRDAAEMRDVA